MSDDSRDQGLEFGSFDDALDDVDYPITNEALVERFGDEELDLPGGETTLREVLSAAPDDDEYESPNEVHEAIKTFVGSEAVGREGTTDRTSGGAEEYEDDQAT